MAPKSFNLQPNIHFLQEIILKSTDVLPRVSWQNFYQGTKAQSGLILLISCSDPPEAGLQSVLWKVQPNEYDIFNFTVLFNKGHGHMKFHSCQH